MLVRRMGHTTTCKEVLVGQPLDCQITLRKSHLKTGMSQGGGESASKSMATSSKRSLVVTSNSPPRMAALQSQGFGRSPLALPRCRDRRGWAYRQARARECLRTPKCRISRGRELAARNYMATTILQVENRPQTGLSLLGKLVARE